MLARTKTHRPSTTAVAAQDEILAIAAFQAALGCADPADLVGWTAYDYARLSRCIEHDVATGRLGCYAGL